MKAWLVFAFESISANSSGGPSSSADKAESITKRIIMNVFFIFKSNVVMIINYFGTPFKAKD